MAVEFHEENNQEDRSEEFLEQQRGSSIIRWLKEKGVIKNEIFAGRILIIIAAIAILVSLIIFTQGRILGIGVGEKAIDDPVILYVEGVGEVRVEEGEKISEVLERYNK